MACPSTTDQKHSDDQLPDWFDCFTWTPPNWRPLFTPCVQPCMNKMDGCGFICKAMRTGGEKFLRRREQSGLHASNQQQLSDFCTYLIIAPLSHNYGSVFCKNSKLIGQSVWFWVAGGSTQACMQVIANKCPIFPLNFGFVFCKYYRKFKSWWPRAYITFQLEVPVSSHGVTKIWRVTGGTYRVPKYLKVTVRPIAFKICVTCCRQKMAVWPGKSILYNNKKTPQKRLFLCASVDRFVFVRGIRAMGGGQSLW